MSPSFPPQRFVVLDAASDLGDAVVSTAVVAGHAVCALSPTPEAVTHFSPVVDYPAIDLQDPEALTEVLEGADAAVLTLGDDERDEELTIALVRAARAVGVARLIVTLPLDALTLTPDGRLARRAPRRARQVRDRMTLLAPATRRPSLLGTRRALELVRLSGLHATVLAHPPIIVAPGPAPLTRISAALAPPASAELSAADAAREILRIVPLESTRGQEYVISEG
ncbi:MAG: NAD(P)H-binding protein [Dermabacter sp.]|nr:NAD(P)H-binding protein [Dermabacter sp.]